MTCSACGHANPDGARFCGACGTALGATVPCPSCGTTNPSGQRFCNGCGARLEALEPVTRTPGGEPALAGERKQVTVLFADVKGSMDLAASLDTEVWRELLERLFTVFIASVDRYEGTVDKFTGDGAMALFGAPAAQEDHADRACLATLHLRDALERLREQVRLEHGIDFATRIGLNSGEVVVGDIGADRNLEYTAIGHTVGLAARMESLAEPGAPCLTAATARLVGDRFDIERLGERQVKGVAAPVTVFALRGRGRARTRLETTAARGLSALVGRGEELAALETALGRVADGRGEVIGVVAEAGLGKSRLCREFAEACARRGMRVTVGRGLAHGRRTPLLPVLELMRAFFGIGERDAPDLARAKVADSLLGLDEPFEGSLPMLFEFLGVADADRPVPAGIAPEARKRALFELVRHLVRVRASEGPALVLVEDLHWLDPASDGLLAGLVEAVKSGPTLLVANFRPEYEASWMRAAHYEELRLSPLGDDRVRELVGGLVGPDPSLDGLAELIAARTGGNPLFVEELVQSLVDGGSLVGGPRSRRLVRSVDELEIPATVQAVLAARIDRLATSDKRVLGAAAVIGREFTAPVLARITGLEPSDLDAVLTSLVAAELLQERAGELGGAYAFKHVLTQEVAYGSQLAERRRATHLLAAEAIEATEPERAEELAAVIAHHHERGGDPLAAARWTARAAIWAGQSHPADGLEHWRAVRRLVADLDAPEAHGLELGACVGVMQVAWRLGLPDAEVAEARATGRRLAEAAEDLRAVATVEAAYGLARGMTGRVREALHHSETAARVARIGGRPDESGYAYWLEITGRMNEALVELDRIVELVGDDWELGRPTLGFSLGIWARLYRGTVLAALGRLDEADRAGRDGLALARAQRDPQNEGFALSVFGSVAYYRGEAGDALAHVATARENAQRVGSAFSHMTALSTSAATFLGAERWEDALEAAEQSLADMRASHVGLHYEAHVLASAAEARLGLGQHEQAAVVAREAVAAARDREEADFEARALIVLGEALAARDEPDLAGARRAFERARELCEAGEFGLTPRMHAGLGRVAALAGDEDGWRRELDEARRGFAAQGATGRLARVEAELAAGAPAPV